jgi:hypothetical protein
MSDKSRDEAAQLVRGWIALPRSTHVKLIGAIAAALDKRQAETWDFVITAAHGCFDYGGGYRGDPEKFKTYHHGIQTVINLLTHARQNGLDDPQVAAVYCYGKQVAAERK